MSITKDVFVIMPFSDTTSCTEAGWTETFEHIFRPAVEACGYSCERAAPGRGNLIVSIIERLHIARIVLADITDRNPNVFYELGVRHSLSKRTLILTRNKADIPSDLRGYWWIEYGTQPAQVEQFKKHAKRIIAEIEANPIKSDSPVSDYLERGDISLSRDVEREITVKTSTEAVLSKDAQRTTEVIKTIYDHLAQEHSLLWDLTSSLPTDYSWLRDAGLKEKWAEAHKTGRDFFHQNRIFLPHEVSKKIASSLESVGHFRLR